LRNAIAGANMSKGMSNIQPKMQELQEKYKDDPKKLSEETMKLLKKEGAGPMKGCLSMLIQLPVFIGLYSVIRKFATGEVPNEWLYSFFNILSFTILRVWVNILNRKSKPLIAERKFTAKAPLPSSERIT